MHYNIIYLQTVPAAVATNIAVNVVRDRIFTLLQNVDF